MSQMELKMINDIQNTEEKLMWTQYLNFLRESHLNFNFETLTSFLYSSEKIKSCPLRYFEEVSPLIVNIFDFYIKQQNNQIIGDKQNV